MILSSSNGVFMLIPGRDLLAGKDVFKGGSYLQRNGCWPFLQIQSLSIGRNSIATLISKDLKPFLYEPLPVKIPRYVELQWASLWYLGNSSLLSDGLEVSCSLILRLSSSEEHRCPVRLVQAIPALSLNPNDARIIQLPIIRCVSPAKRGTHATHPVSGRTTQRRQ